MITHYNELSMHNNKEKELRGKIDDLNKFRDQLNIAGAKMSQKGFMQDYYFDNPFLNLKSKNQKLRIRVIDYKLIQLCWKGPISVDKQTKIREEIEVGVKNVESLIKIFEKLGFQNTRFYERYFETYLLYDVKIRIEQFPIMDILVEIEGEQHLINRAVTHLDISKDVFGPKTLVSFIKEYEIRNGTPAKLSGFPDNYIPFK